MRNPRLYAAMKKVFGVDPKIINEGEACRLVDVFADYSFIPRTQDLPASCTKGGEQYAVCCPFCGDTRYRLYISHMWDTEFVQGNCRYHCSDKLLHCFNESCMSNTENRLKICNSLREAMGQITEIDEGELVPMESSAGNELSNQSLYPQDERPLNDPHTPNTIIDYLNARRFDINTLSDAYHVEWLDNFGRFKHPLLVVPVNQNEEYWFWQGRLIPVDGTEHGEIEQDPYTGKPFPKYYFPHGVKKAWALYNIDKACLRNTVFIVEGVTDVWAIGNTENYSAVAKFGKQLSTAQLEILCRKCFGKHIIIVPDMDDPEAFDVACEDAMRLEIANVFLTVEIACPPQGMDPCDMLRIDNEKGGVACQLAAQAKSVSEARRTMSIFGSQANQ